MRLIDADALVETFEKNARIAARFGSNAPAFRYLELAFAVNNAPTVDAVPVRHGRWARDMGGVWCSVCGEYSEGKYAYCPSCGAKMYEEEP